MADPRHTQPGANPDRNRAPKTTANTPEIEKSPSMGSLHNHSYQTFGLEGRGCAVAGSGLWRVLVWGSLVVAAAGACRRETQGPEVAVEDAGVDAGVVIADAGPAARVSSPEVRLTLRIVDGGESTFLLQPDAGRPLVDAFVGFTVDWRPPQAGQFRFLDDRDSLVPSDELIDRTDAGELVRVASTLLQKSAPGRTHAFEFQGSPTPAPDGGAASPGATSRFEVAVISDPAAEKLEAATSKKPGARPKQKRRH